MTPQAILTPTVEQNAICDFVEYDTRSLLVSALAGAAKTTTLKLAAQKLPSSQSTLAIAFNKRIAEDLSRALPAFITTSTLNALGHRAWGNFIGKRLDLNTKKTSTIVSDIVKQNKLDLTFEQKVGISDLINSAKMVGLVPDSCKFPHTSLVPDNDSTWELLATQCDIDLTPAIRKLATAGLLLSITKAYGGMIDFNDQLYMSVCFNAPYQRYQTILVDEAQDLSPMNHQQISRSALPNTRVIIVGDVHQSIYAFRGADPSSIGKLARQFNAEELTLSTTFRCPEEICKVVRKHVPNIVSGCKHEGTVTTLDSWKISDIPPDAAVLCRNNAPLVSLAFKVFKAGRPVTMLGRDIGKGLEKVLRKFPADMSGTPLLEAVKNHILEEQNKAASDAKVSMLEDKLECLVMLIESNKTSTVEQLVETLRAIFSAEGKLIFATGHKSKGLEFNTVFHLDPWRIGVRKSADEVEITQENNLRYVINTRAKRELFFVNYDNLED